MALSVESELNQYAELVIRVGLNLQPGQKLMIQAPIQTAPTVRALVAAAYRAGSPLVDVFWSDDEVELARFQHAPRDSFHEFPVWRAQAIEVHLAGGNAFLKILAENPDLLKGQDPDLIAQARRSGMQHSLPVNTLISRNAANWCVVSIPTPGWSAKVFPGLPAEEAEQNLWEAIFDVCRIHQPNPVEAWRSHLAQLAARRDTLTGKAYSALHLRSTGTDLRVGLPAGHIWRGGQQASEAGMLFTPNMPTDEVFTLPDRCRVDGYFTASKPLSYNGMLINDFRLTFEAGQVVDHAAGEGQELLSKLLDTDEGARRLGEIALVPYSAPVSQVGVMFYNTLYDENAASHVALGRAYAFTLQGGEAMDTAAFAAAGGNTSLVHVDVMLGSADMDVDGIRADGSVEPVMRAGEWAFDV